MARRTFKNWITSYKKLLLKRGVENEESIKTLDDEACRETHYNNGCTIEEAFNDAMYYSNS